MVLSTRSRRSPFLALALSIGLTSHASVSLVRAVAVATTSTSAVVTAGQSTSFVFPPVSAFNAASSFASFFPNEAEINIAGPTPTGDEPEEVATAPTALYPLHTADAFPLVPAQPFDDETSTTSVPGADNSSDADFDILRSFGNLSPVYAADFGFQGEVTERVPEGCELTQVHLLHRHGARYPTSGSQPVGLAKKLLNATVNGTGFEATGLLTFLNSWENKLGAEILTPFGRQQLYELGVETRMKYGELLKSFVDLPVFRTTSQDRMVKSALQFAGGFFGIPDYQTDYRQLLVIENYTDLANNNTLAATCGNSDGAAGNLGSEASTAWTQVYLQDAVTRINGFLDNSTGSDLSFTVSDVLGMQLACAYETNALGYSSFCDLFTAEEWQGFSYYIDLSFWYGNGPGNPTTAAIGIGWVAELVSRLTQTRIPVHNSTTNGTLDDNPVTFPLDQSIYVDATHDTQISAILVAMNFSALAANGPLPTDQIPEDQTYLVHSIAPFGARMVGQVMTCPASSSSSNSTDTESFIRWILNEGVVPLTGVSGCPAPSTSTSVSARGSGSDGFVPEAYGLCPLSTFVHAMNRRLSEVDYDFACNGNYTVPPIGEGGIVDGQPYLSERPAVPADA